MLRAAFLGDGGPPFLSQCGRQRRPVPSIRPIGLRGFARFSHISRNAYPRGAERLAFTIVRYSCGVLLICHNFSLVVGGGNGGIVDWPPLEKGRADV